MFVYRKTILEKSDSHRNSSLPYLFSFLSYEESIFVCHLGLFGRFICISFAIITFIET